MFVSTDANMVEVNPLILTKEEKIICLDAKVNFDTNALFRHPEIVKLRDLNEEDTTEIEASKHDLAYIKLDGSIVLTTQNDGVGESLQIIIWKSQRTWILDVSQRDILSIPFFGLAFLVFLLDCEGEAEELALRLAAEEEERKKAAEELAAEEEARKKAAEELALRLAAEEEARKKAQEEQDRATRKTLFLN